MNNFQNDIISILNYDYNISPDNADKTMLYNAVSKAVVKQINSKWTETESYDKKRACYFSAEFLTGLMIYNNLYNTGLFTECEDFLRKYGFEPSVFEEIEDNALGNGGLGRLAACFLDSAATHSIPLDGYGIRYKYGIFKQYFENGFQCEKEDDWTRFGDPWSIRRDECSETITFGDQTVIAVPYDMPIIGYGNKMINTLRLWQSEPLNKFNFGEFNNQKYDEAFRERNLAEAISSVLYPNDSNYEGKVLRLKQQYFFSSASIKSMIRNYVSKYGNDFSKFTSCYSIQLNDTHPISTIPEFMRILIADYHIPVQETIDITNKLFAYTNHTVMAEAMEKWDVSLFRSVLPDVYPYVVFLNDNLTHKFHAKGISGNEMEKFRIINNDQIHMARMGIYASHSVNGVAHIHTEILKNSVLKEWYELYPERFNNKTNGITQRRWLALCNPELSAFITERIGDKWITDLNDLKNLNKYVDDKKSLDDFRKIKNQKKLQLCEYIKKHEGVTLNPDFIFDIQIKRLHEYKRQLLNILSIIDIYYCIKDGTIKDFNPTVFLFGAKAAPRYYRAKGIIKLINEVSTMVNADESVSNKIKVLFVQNYNVSYAQKLIPAADISEQISTAGTEASGTGNMKFMLNGAVTLGTLDGANAEIVEQAGEENNYIFGAKVYEISQIYDSYNSLQIYNQNPRIKRALDTLVNGTFSDNDTGMFRELYNSLLYGADWHKPDHYFLLHDFQSYTDTRLRANKDYSDTDSFTKKCFANTINSGKFSADRTVLEYSKEIWDL